MQVHRYWNRVGVYINPEGETLYLSPKEARALAKALNAAAREISAETPFTDSQVGTWSAPAGKATHGIHAAGWNA